MLLIVIIVFLVFGPEKVPEVGRALGRAMREFRKAMAEIERSVDEQAAAGPEGAHRSAGNRERPRSRNQQSRLDLGTPAGEET